MVRSSPVRALLAFLSPKARALVVMSAVAGAAARVGVLLAATFAVGGRVDEATAVGASAVVAFGVTRVLRTAARIEVECDLYRALTRAWTAGDVLSVPSVEPSRALFEGGGEALALVSNVIPALASDVVAVLVAAPILASLLPPRVLMVALSAALAMVVCLALLRRMSAQIAERIGAARQRAVDLVSTALDGRLELVMQGAEHAHLARLEDALARYKGVARGSAVVSALLGRAPIAAGIAAIAALVIVDGVARAEVASVIVGQSVALAACVPPALGVVLGVHEIARAGEAVGALLAMLGVAPRPEMGRDGIAPAALPASVELDRVSFRYASEGRPVVRELTAEWASSPLVLTGRNGAGKSTILYLIGGLRAPDGGVVRVGGRDLQAIDVHAVRENIAYVPQRPYLGPPHATVRAALSQFAPSADASRMIAALDRLGVLSELTARDTDPLAIRVGELSAGQRQRVALARVLLRDAQLVLLDEPDLNLDREGVRLVSELIEQLSKSGVMVAVAAHTPELTARAAARIALG
jgi:ABC-type bacteriocin/lantibiotic exporter with double-glycine peptidase domain